MTGNNTHKEYVDRIAKVCHDANKSFCEVHGDNSQLPWEEAPEWQKESMRLGVNFTLSNPDAPVDAQHNAWLEHKVKKGWVYGVAKDSERKTHPCIVSYNMLPRYQQVKDMLSRSIVNSLK